MLEEKKKDKILSKFDLFKKYNKLKNKNSTGATLGNVVSTKEKRNTVRYSKGRNRKFIFYLIPFCSGEIIMNERIIDYIGEENFRKIENAKVLLIGLGGVGGYTFEVLVRSGIKFITVIDFDIFENSNFNRQIYATIDTLNKNKAQIAALRASKINPEAKITCLDKKLSQDDITKEFVTEYDYILDACDDTLVKVELMKVCALYHVKLISCMGTANRMCPEMLEITSLKKTFNDPLAKKIRMLLKGNSKALQTKVVWSREVPKKQKKLGTLCMTPMSAGSLLASFVIRDILETEKE